MKVNIYKIICEHTNYLNEIYIGSTKRCIDVRFKEHMCVSKSKKKKYNSKLYELADEIGWNNFKIILIENCNVLDKKQQLKKEQEYIDFYNPTLNINSASGQSCIHNRLRSICKECKGGSICMHNRIRSYCKECKGGSICEHNRSKYNCKECKGSSICEHNRIKSVCKECKGSSICEHNRRKSRCKECKGGSICIHNRSKYDCKECKGGRFCIHNRSKFYCKDCNNFYCDFCDKNYGSKPYLYKHILKHFYNI